ncbi:MAG: hypothetical protein WAT12_13090 [Candidatus Nitrotoga sp.]
MKSTRLWYGEQEQVDLGSGDGIHITIPRGRYKELVASMEIASEISAPIAMDQKLGQVNISLDNEVIVSKSIIAHTPCFQITTEIIL